jgi:SNF2 family DNA or RNA helicase
MKPSEVIKFSRPLWKHQADVLDRFAHKHEAALLHEMGTGKTTSAIAWLRAKYNLGGQILPTLIVSPVATLHNWREEIERNAPPKVLDATLILEGSQMKRIKLLEEPDKKIFITNPEAFDMQLLSDSLRKRFKIVIVDEVHRFKNPKSKRLQRLLWVSDSTEHRMILTGTPILNSYLDLWAQWRILDRGSTFGMNFYSFRNRYFEDENIRWKGQPKYFPKYVPKKGIAPEISALIDFKASRVLKEECMDLPDKVYKIEQVPLSDEQSKVYRQMENELIAYVNSGACVASNALTQVLRLLQILSGYVQVETTTAQKYAHRLKENPRLARLSELLEEIAVHSKVIVWCEFKENYAAIREVCENLGLDYAEIHGEKGDHRNEEMRFRNDLLCRVMIANPKAGGVGINLVEASYAIYYTRGYSLGDRLQSEDRCHRGGSEKHSKITYIDLVAPGTLDEAVLNALLRKENFADNILERLAKR